MALAKRLKAKRDGWSWEQVVFGLEAKGYDIRREMWPDGRPGALVGIRKRRLRRR